MWLVVYYAGLVAVPLCVWCCLCPPEVSPIASGEAGETLVPADAQLLLEEVRRRRERWTRSTKSRQRDDTDWEALEEGRHRTEEGETGEGGDLQFHEMYFGD